MLTADRADAKLTVKAVVERADTSATAVELLSVMKTSGVTANAAPNVTVHEFEFVPDVMSPVVSLDPAVIVPPDGEQETVGGIGVLDAVR